MSTKQVTKMFVNLPVADLDKSVGFFTGLGFEFNAQFTDENASAMVINDDCSVMLLSEPFFKTFTKKQVADAVTHTEAILCISAESREDVDTLVHKALEAGGKPAQDKADHGFMYNWSFQDLDGHLWEVMYMDPSAIEQ